MHRVHSKASILHVHRPIYTLLLKSTIYLHTSADWVCNNLLILVCIHFDSESAAIAAVSLLATQTIYLVAAQIPALVPTQTIYLNSSGFCAFLFGRVATLCTEFASIPPMVQVVLDAWQLAECMIR